MGIITMALIAANLQSGDEVQGWVRFACALAMGLGTSVGGYKIIKTVGGKIMKIRPINGAAADLSSASIIFGATLISLTSINNTRNFFCNYGCRCSTTCKRCTLGYST